MELEALVDPDGALTDEISRRLGTYNARTAPDLGYERVAVVARDADGALRGGVWGELYWGWLFIQSLWVDDARRGQGLGSALLRRIEALAVERGITRAHLETTSFQAPAFYARHGYQVVGQLDGKPPGAVWYFMAKTTLGE